MNKPITISYTTFCSTDKLQQSLENLQSQDLIRIKSHEIGADREQWFVKWYDHLLVICVEHLSESAWIEAMSAVSEEKLQIFYKQLICD